MRGKTLNQKIDQFAKWMQPTSHYKDRTKMWTPDQSEILRTLIQDPKIANCLFWQAKKSMEFDEKSNLWVGKAWKEKLWEVKPNGYF